ncbi:MAG: thioesterase [Clostridia bacterium]|nr:thioesterase [Clostridia bacterium]
MIFTLPFTVASSETDINGICRFSALMRHLQDAAFGQTETYGPNEATLRRLHAAFMVIRFAGCLYAPLYRGDVLTTETFGTYSRGFSYGRDYRILRKEETVFEASSVWALADTDKRKPFRVGEIAMGFDEDPPLSFCPPRLTLPKQDMMTFLTSHRVSYSEADGNRHLNNTVYPDMFCDALDMENKRISFFSVNYVSEAPLGTVLALYGKSEGDTTFFRANKEDGRLCTEAQITLTSL